MINHMKWVSCVSCQVFFNGKNAWNLEEVKVTKTIIHLRPVRLFWSLLHFLSLNFGDSIYRVGSTRSPDIGRWSWLSSAIGKMVSCAVSVMIILVRGGRWRNDLSLFRWRRWLLVQQILAEGRGVVVISRIGGNLSVHLVLSLTMVQLIIMWWKIIFVDTFVYRN